MVNGDNLTVCGNPYALLLYSVGEDFEKDPTLSQESNCIQCYTKRFDDNEYLAAFRNPHNSPNNICYLHNVHSKEIDKYFAFSQNIIAVNCIHTDIQDRATIKILCPYCKINLMNSTSTMCEICHKKYNTEKLYNIISRDNLKKLIRSTPFTHIADMYKVTDNTIRKWCDKYKLPRKVSDIQKYTDEEWKIV